MGVTAYAAATGLSLKEIAKQVAPENHCAWFLGEAQVHVRHMLECFLNHHELGLDATNVEPIFWRYSYSSNLIMPYLVALSNHGAPVQGLEVSCGRIPTTVTADAPHRTAEFLAAWYSRLPALARWVGLDLREVLVPLPKILDSARYAAQPSVTRQAVADLTDYVRNQLSDKFRCFLIHGSYGTEDFVERSSDLDVFAVVSGDVLSSAEALLALRQAMIPLWTFLCRADPLQHHGIMLVGEPDLDFYPQVFFPYVLVSHAQTVLGGGLLRILERNDAFHRCSMASSMLQYFRRYLTDDGARQRLHQAFYLKHFISTLFLAPAILLQQNGQYSYKKNALPRAYSLLSDEDKPTLELPSWLRSAGLLSAEIAWPFSPDHMTTIWDIKAFHNAVLAINTPSEVEDYLGPLFVESAHMLIEALHARIKGRDPPALHSVTCFDVTDRCIFLAASAYNDLISEIRGLLRRYPGLSVGQFGRVWTPGISDVDLIIRVEDDHGWSLVDSLVDDIMTLGGASSYLLVHRPSMVVSAELAEHLPAIYPIFGEISWLHARRDNEIQNVDPHAFAIEQFAALAELSVTYFIHADQTAFLSRSIPERATLLRAWGLRHSNRVLAQIGLEPSDQPLIDKIGGLRANFFSLSPDERSSQIGDLLPQLLPCQLEIIDQIRKHLPGLVDASFLSDFDRHEVVARWDPDTLFVTEWDVDFALRSMRHFMKKTGRKLLSCRPNWPYCSGLTLDAPATFGTSYSLASPIGSVNAASSWIAFWRNAWV